MALAYPTALDLKTLLYAAGFIDSAAAPTGRAASLDYESAVNAAKAEFERKTGRKFLAGTASARVFDPPTDADGILYPGEEFTSVSSITWLGDALTVTTDYMLLPYDAPDRNLPYNAIRFYARFTAPRPWASLQGLIITATWGRDTGELPDDVFQAVLRRAALILAPEFHAALTQGAQSVKQDDASITYAGAGVLGAVGDTWKNTWEATVNGYASWRVY